MFHHWQLVTLSIIYIGLLFVVAFLGDKYRHQLFGNVKAIIYALTLGVYCTSWSFLGTTGQTSTNIFSHIPIYLGPILLFVFAWPFIKRIIQVSLKLNITSIADLLASRFGNSNNLAKLVTVVALIGTLPYMALQLKSIIYAFDLLQVEPIVSVWQLGLIVSLVLAGFTVLFGIRNIDVNECHPGVMLAIAFESVIKILAFIVLAGFVCFQLFDSPTQIWQQANIDISEQLSLPNIGSMFAMLIIVMAAFLSLPRQFQVMVVEASSEHDTKFSRQIFITYLAIFALLAIPLGLAGQVYFGQTVSADSYVLLLSGLHEQGTISFLTFLGTISAASSMMIISAIALSTMVSNEIIFPFMFRTKKQLSNYQEFRLKLLNIRKLVVLGIMMMGYGSFLMVSPERLSSLGEIAFGAIAQLTPALVAAFYWRNASLTGVFSGITTGFSLWLFINFLPNIGLYELTFASEYLSNNTGATLLSLTCNIVVLIVTSMLSRKSVHERVQATFFTEEGDKLTTFSQKKVSIDSSELYLLLVNFLGEDKAEDSFANFKMQPHIQHLSTAEYNQQLVIHSEKSLATVMGSSSARLVIQSVLQGRNVNLTELATLIEEASNQQQILNLNLLHSAIEHASEGISIIDKDLNLVAWNKKYLDIFSYPKGLAFIGSPIEDLIRFNLKQSFESKEDIEKAVQKRLDHLKQRTSHSSERQHHSGQVIRIEGNPLPDGGFVMIFRDITTFRKAERVLKDQKLDLESEIQERTQKLEKANALLAISHKKAEFANQKKSLYLKACSHDLMQPLEAARLFTSALATQNKLSETQRRQVNNIDQSLKVANDLLSSLGEIARIESGNIVANNSKFSLYETLSQLEQDFSASAKERQVEFEVEKAQIWVDTDSHLLRRILQNLLTNAFRYASPGKVAIKIKAIDDQVQISVIDNGPGIAPEEQEIIFEQFTQLENGKNHSAQGLGLGLSITQSFAKILNMPLKLESTLGQGCSFSLTLPIARAMVKTPNPVAKQISLQGLSVLCIDNDPKVLAGMVELLNAWQCKVYGVASQQEAVNIFKRHGNNFEILLVDYQLDNDENGLEIIAHLRKMSQREIPAILITATTDTDIVGKTQKANVGYMRKMVKPAALRAMMSSILTKSMQDKYT